MLTILTSPTIERSNALLKEKTLLQELQKGSEEALEELYAIHSKMVYLGALKILKNQSLAEETTQEVFLSLWKNSQNIDLEKGSIKSWLAAAGHHKAVDYIRHEESQKRKSTAIAQEMHIETQEKENQHTNQPLEKVLQQSDANMLKKVMKILSKEQREAIVLSYYGGYTQTEIASITKTPLGTVKTRMLSGMKKMRQHCIEINFNDIAHKTTLRSQA